MKTYSEPAEYAWLMKETGFKFYLIYPYIHAQDAYFASLEDDEKGNEEEMTDFIHRTTKLTWKKIHALQEAQLKFMKTEISEEEEDSLVCRMLKSLRTKDRAMAGTEFLRQVYEYPLHDL